MSLLPHTLANRRVVPGALNRRFRHVFAAHPSIDRVLIEAMNRTEGAHCRRDAWLGRQIELVPAQSSGSWLSVPSQRQLIGSSIVGGETWAVALNDVNFPVPPENVHTPRPVVRSSVQ